MLDYNLNWNETKLKKVMYSRNSYFRSHKIDKRRPNTKIRYEIINDDVWENRMPRSQPHRLHVTRTQLCCGPRFSAANVRHSYTPLSSAYFLFRIFLRKDNRRQMLLTFLSIEVQNAIQFCYCHFIAHCSSLRTNLYLVAGIRFHCFSTSSEKN